MDIVEQTKFVATENVYSRNAIFGGTEIFSCVTWYYHGIMWALQIVSNERYATQKPTSHNHRRNPHRRLKRGQKEKDRAHLMDQKRLDDLHTIHDSKLT